MNPSAVLLDMGGTLLREGTDDLRAGVEALLRHPLFAASASRSGARRPSIDDLVEDLAEACERVHTTNVAGFTILRWLREILPETRDAELGELELALWGPIPSMDPLPGVLEALTELRRRLIPMGVVSNAVFSGRALEAELDRHALGGFFEFVLSSADVGARKPDPRIFRAALDRLGIGPQGVWFVGDVWEKDVAGASAAGMVPFWIGGGDPPPGSMIAHHRIASWREFLERLERS